MSALLHLARWALWLVGAAAFRVYGATMGARGPAPGPPLDRESPLRILVVRLDLLGDVVFSIPAIEALATAFPRGRIDVLALPYTAPILRRVPAVATVREFDVNRYRRPRGWLAIGDLVRAVGGIRRERYDVAIGLSGLMGGVFAAWSGARWRVGYAPETYQGCYNLPVPGRRYTRRQHEVEYCLDLVRALGVQVAAGARPSLTPTSNRQRSTALAPDTGPTESRYAVLVPGASNGAAKRWPPPLWAQLGDRIATDLGLRLVVAGAPSERELSDAVMRHLFAPATNVVGQTSLDELIDLLQAAAVVVAGDTGPLHVAAALGTPVVGIYGPTDPTNSGPLAERSEVVRLGLTCSPCYDLRSPADCKLPDRSTVCMSGLAPTLVFEALARVLDRDRKVATVLETG